MATVTVLRSFRILSAPFSAGPPNGCVPRETVREETEIELFTADWYGTLKEYVHGRKRWTDADGKNPGPWFGGFSDGDPRRIAHWLSFALAASS